MQSPTTSPSPTTTLASLLAIALLLPAACNGDSARDDDGVGGGASTTSALDDYVRAFCEQRQQCGCPGQTTVDACSDELATVPLGDWSLDASCMIHHEERLARIGCGAGDPLPPTCMDRCSWFVGNAGLGAPCSHSGGVDTTCSAGLVCDAFTGNSTCVPTCPNGKLGSSCVSGFDCSPELQCASDGRCSPRQQPGATCEAGACELGYHCSLDGACVLTPGLGEPCADNRCGPGAECDSTSNLCVSGNPIVCF